MSASKGERQATKPFENARFSLEVYSNKEFTPKKVVLVHSND
jgi:hypothetical protein